MSLATILIASPREPSGSSWLINCLLELGVRVNFKPAIDRVWRGERDQLSPRAMWQAAGQGRWALHPRAEALRKWLPILDRQETLAFRDDVEALYVQELSRPEFVADRTVLFLRDPRDAIHSYYRRVQAEMSLAEFVRWPHHETLLDVIDHWRLFVEGWLYRDNVYLYRFEDYKADAAALLRRIVRDLGFDATDGQIAAAAAESSYEKARAAEERYRATHPLDGEVAMRAGLIGEWRTSAETIDLSSELEARLGPLLSRLGYAAPVSEDAALPPYAVSQSRFLDAFQHIDLPPALQDKDADPLRCADLSRLLQFAATLDIATIRRARLQPWEARSLLDSLEEYAGAWQEAQRARVRDIRGAFEDGAAYHLELIRNLAAGRRARGTARE